MRNKFIYDILFYFSSFIPLFKTASGLSFYHLKFENNIFIDISSNAFYILFYMQMIADRMIPY